ncbi:MAG: hypothetical protein NC911_08720 [Candidatus Omnitrophica bacterium]|nr:hypothetical protein [Candidatus Omnitrophota bacterium]
MRAAEKDLYSPPDRPGLLCYGPGYDNWGVQTNQKAMVAYAVLATDPFLNEKRAGFTREEIREKALSLFRFSLASHLEGDFCCSDGRKWGHTWISVLGLERMMPGIETLGNYLSEKDKELLRRVLISEADWLVDSYSVKAGLVKNNWPESNLWNGCFLHRVALLYPDTPRAAAYREKGTEFLVNGISIPADSVSEEIISEKKVKDWFVGANFFESFALDHHGYLNVGYMVICLSQVALLHFSARINGWQTPKALYRHVKELWQLVKTLTFPDGRLFRLGGDTRIRYCYCQDYAIPTWLLAADYLKDKDAPQFEAAWLKVVSAEAATSQDGSFLKTRCHKLKEISPLYYTRLEADRAVCLSLGAYWRRQLNIQEEISVQPLKQWSDEYHGACFVKGEKRVASFCWKAAQPPQIMCLPVRKSDLAEWRENLAGRVISPARYHYQIAKTHQEILFPGGFLVFGQTQTVAKGFLAEGQFDMPISCGWLAVAALPDDRTLLVIQKQISCHYGLLFSVQGLLLNIPNDVFNRFQRTYYTACGLRKIVGGPGKRKLLRLNSPWVNVDNTLGVSLVYGASSLFVYQPGRRQAGLLLGQFEAQVIETGLAVDEICSPCHLQPHLVETGEELYDIGAVVQTGVSWKQTAQVSRNCTYLSGLPAEVKNLKTVGADGNFYLLLVNSGQGKQEIAGKALSSRVYSFTKRQFISRIILKPGEADLVRLKD